MFCLCLFNLKLDYWAADSVHCLISDRIIVDGFKGLDPNNSVHTAADKFHFSGFPSCLMCRPDHFFSEWRTETCVEAQMHVQHLWYKWGRQKTNSCVKCWNNKSFHQFLIINVLMLCTCLHHFSCFISLTRKKQAIWGLPKFFNYFLNKCINLQNNWQICPAVGLKVLWSFSTLVALLSRVF